MHWSVEIVGEFQDSMQAREFPITVRRQENGRRTIGERVVPSRKSQAFAGCGEPRRVLENSARGSARLRESVVGPIRIEPQVEKRIGGSRVGLHVGDFVFAPRSRHADPGRGTYAIEPLVRLRLSGKSRDPECLRRERNFAMTLQRTVVTVARRIEAPHDRDRSSASANRAAGFKNFAFG